MKWFNKVYNAARQAAIHDTIIKFPQKYATVVGERGLKVTFFSPPFFSIYLQEHVLVPLGLSLCSLSCWSLST